MGNRHVLTELEKKISSASPPPPQVSLVCYLAVWFIIFMRARWQICPGCKLHQRDRKKKNDASVFIVSAEL